MFDLPPGAERTVQYADFLASFDPSTRSESKGQGAPRVSFVLVTIPSEVARGVVARSVAALLARRSLGEGGSKGPFGGTRSGPHRVIGYIENMSGYYCRECNAVRPLFAAPDPSDLGIPCLGTVPFDPELARLCDRGIPLADLPESPVGRALDHVATQLLDSL
jgi:hypothetical protein